MPAYNEEQTITKITEKCLSQKINGIDSIEILMIDDCSKDQTLTVMRQLEKKYPQIKVLSHEQNQGKGAAIRTALRHISGDICLIQDADLEYDPADYPYLLEPIVQGRADCVYGSRFVGTQAKRVLFFWHSVGNKFLTLLSNMLTNINLTDMETCYKAFRSDILKSITIESDDFRFEPEVTIKIAKKRCRIFEVGISYSGRTYAEGKKINWVDGIKAIWAMFRFSLWA